jgi:hypothetical protein
MLAEGKPELAVGFPGGRGTAHMTHVARVAGVDAAGAVLRALRLDWWRRQPKHAGGPWGGPFYLLGDEPTPFSPISEWEAFLDVLLTLDPRSTMVQRLVADAMATMARIEARERD